ncbi:CD2-associated protein isoform X3 [Drosophila willistoni]|uniref:CD2-associated protein isoform X3 n=1 Tax=Drosophila willistoni TaxID=7260 RepID=UPI000C26C33A|nr:CD2-associated protein isoform X3 [Drosophila willistoni]
MDNIRAIVEYEYAAKEPDELDLQKGAIIHRIKQMPGGWWQGTLKANGKTGMFPDNFVRVLDSNNTTNSNGNHSGDDSAAAVQLRDKSTTSNRRCKVIYSYTQVNDDELTLAVGDVIEFLGEVEEGWWRGRLRSKVGVFPSNFVQHIEPSPILASKRPPTIGATVTTSALTRKGPPKPPVATVSASSIREKNRVNASNNIAATTAAPPSAEEADIPGVPMLPPKPQREFCRVEFPYAPQNEDELELKVDEIITIITTELPDKGWWKGEIRGKVGVFPDNFVKLLPPTEVAPINEPTTTTTATAASATTTTQSQKKITNTIANATSHMTTTNSSNSNTTTVTQQQQQQQSTTGGSSTTSKVYIKKTGSSSNSSSSASGRKESFGSRDSLNDILSETGLPSGNVAAQRKSLENKNLDLTKQPGSSQAAKGNSTITTITASSSSNTSSSSSTTAATSSTSYTELRKSLDNMDEKIKSPPPPVLSKKPNVPLKKTPTGGVPVGGPLMASNLKKKNPEGKLTSAVSHDLADGLTASKLVSGNLPDSGAPGSIVMRRAATIAVEDTDFDRVERASILTDMRAGRVKAPKRRPPSAAINVLGESNNNSVYVSLNGASEPSEDAGIGGKTAQAIGSSDDNSTGEEQLAKPKPREWQQKKAPWMEELKASQVTRKKPTPSTEPRGASVAERTSKLFATEQAATSSVVTTTASSSTTNSSSSTTTKVQSSAITSSNLMQQSMFVDSSNKKEVTASVVTTSTSSSTSSNSNSNINNTSTTNDAIMSKSMSKSALATASSDEETRVTRPNSLSIRNRSVSPLVKSANASSSNSSIAEEKNNQASTVPEPAVAAPAAAPPAAATAAPATVQLNNHHQDTSAPLVYRLEQRVDKLEATVQSQQRTIEELIRTLREETERVKLLRGELDKYAQKKTHRGKLDNWMF